MLRNIEWWTRSDCHSRERIHCLIADASVVSVEGGVLDLVPLVRAHDEHVVTIADVDQQLMFRDLYIEPWEFGGYAS